MNSREADTSAEGGGPPSPSSNRVPLPPVLRLGPLHATGTLRLSRVTSPTLKHCVMAVMDLLTWSHLSQGPIPVDSRIDFVMCRYFNLLFDDGHLASIGRYTLFGFLLLVPRNSTSPRDRLPLSREALKAWTARRPYSSRAPVPLGLLFVFAQVFAEDLNSLDAAVALVA